MQQRYVGRTGLRVFRLGLGSMGWGAAPTRHRAPAGSRLRRRQRHLDRHGRRVCRRRRGTSPRRGARHRARPREWSAPDARRSRPRRRGRRSRAAGARVVDMSRRGLLARLDGTLAHLRVDHLDLWQLQPAAPRCRCGVVFGLRAGGAERRDPLLRRRTPLRLADHLVGCGAARGPAGPIASARPISRSSSGTPSRSCCRRRRRWGWASSRPRRSDVGC